MIGIVLQIVNLGKFRIQLVRVATCGHRHVIISISCYLLDVYRI